MLTIMQLILITSYEYLVVGIIPRILASLRNILNYAIAALTLYHLLSKLIYDRMEILYGKRSHLKLLPLSSTTI